MKTMMICVAGIAGAMGFAAGVAAGNSSLAPMASQCRGYVCAGNANAGIFAALKDSQLFQRVSIELGVLTWPSGADLDPLWVHEEIGKNKTWCVPVQQRLPLGLDKFSELRR